MSLSPLAMRPPGCRFPQTCILSDSWHEVQPVMYKAAEVRGAGRHNLMSTEPNCAFKEQWKCVMEALFITTLLILWVWSYVCTRKKHSFPHRLSCSVCIHTQTCSPSSGLSRLQMFTFICLVLLLINPFSSNKLCNSRRGRETCYILFVIRKNISLHSFLSPRIFVL